MCQHNSLNDLTRNLLTALSAKILSIIKQDKLIPLTVPSVPLELPLW